MRNRRWLAWALSLLMLLSVLPAAQAARSDAEATDTYCPSERNNHRHSFRQIWEDPGYCGEPNSGWRGYQCQYCGYEKSESVATPHTWGSWRTTQEATCTRTGTRTRTCRECGQEQTESLPKADHTWGSWRVTREATCAETGSRVRTCQVCGEEQTETIARTAHTWGDWEIIVEATDHSSGTRAHTCQVCGESETVDYDPEGTLRRGDRGDAVRRMQQLLADQGYLGAGGADGSFGPGTESAVQAFQAAEGLTADGVGWPQTQQRLEHEFGDWETVTPTTDFSAGLRRRTCVKCGYAETEEVYPAPMYRRGDRGDGVQALQQALNDAGYDCGTPDGDFGGRTERAVSNFETANGIPADGIAWPGVLKLLGIGQAVPKVQSLVRKLGDEANPILKLVLEDDWALPAYYIGDAPVFFYQLTNRGDAGVTGLTLRWELTDLEGEVLDTGDQAYVVDTSIDAGQSKRLWGEVVIPDDFYLGRDYRLKLWVYGQHMATGQEIRSNAVAYDVRLESTRQENFLQMTGAIEVQKDRYQVGDTVIVQLLVHNENTEEIDGSIGVPWFDETGTARGLQGLIKGENGLNGTQHFKLLPNGYHVGIAVYTITQEDAAKGAATLHFMARGVKKGTSHNVNSNVVTFRLPVEAGEAERLISLSGVQLQSQSEGYAIGDFASFQLRLTNNSGRKLAVFTLYETGDNNRDIVPGVYSGLAGAGDLASGETYPFHTVYEQLTAEAAARGRHSPSWFVAGFLEDGTYVESNEVGFVLEPVVEKLDRAIPAALALDVEEYGSPRAVYTVNDQGFSEALDFSATVTNTGATPVLFKNIQVFYGSNKKLNREVINLTTPVRLEPGESHSLPLSAWLFDSYADKLSAAEQKNHGCDSVEKLVFTAYGLDPDSGDIVCRADSGAFTYYIANAQYLPEGLVRLGLGAYSEQTFATRSDDLMLWVEATNTGTATLEDVSAIIYVSDDCGTELETITLEGLAMELEPGDTFSYPLEYEIPELDNEADALKFTVYAFNNGGDAQIGGPVEFQVKLVPEDAEDPLLLTLDGECSKAYAVPGETVTLSFAVRNHGFSPLRNVEIYADIEGLNEATLEDDLLMAHSDAILEGGMVYTATYDYTLPEDAVSGGGVVFHILALAETLDGVPVSTDAWSPEVITGGVGSGFGPDDLPTLMLTAAEIPPIGPDESGVDVELTLTNNGALPLQLSGFEHNLSDSVSEEGWMQNPLESGESYTCTYHIDLSGDFDFRDWGYRYVNANAVEPVSGEPAHAYLALFFIQKTADASLRLLVHDTTGTGGKVGETLAVDFTLYNNGDVPLENLEFSAMNGSDEAATEDSVSVSDPSRLALLAPGEALELTYYVLVQDADAAVGGVQRTFVATGRTAAGEPVSDADEIHLWVDGGASPAELTLYKSVVSVPQSPEGYAEGETVTYSIVATNVGENPVTDVEIYDKLHGTNEDAMVDVATELAPGASLTGQFDYTVTAEDVERGYIENTASVSWMPYESEDPKEIFSNAVSVPTTAAGHPKDARLLVEKFQWNLPADEAGYAEGETIEYRIFVTNMTDAPMAEIEVCDPLNGTNEDLVVDRILTLAPHEEKRVKFEYTVTAEDVARGYVDNFAYAAWIPEGEESYRDSYSNNVRIPTVGGAASTGKVRVALAEISTPEKPNGYDVNETVSFRVDVTNESEEVVAYVNTFVYMTDAEVGYELEPIDDLQPHETRSLVYDYVVTEEDLERLYITAQAVAAWKTEAMEEEDIAKSDSLTVYMYVEGDPPVPLFEGLSVTQQVISTPAGDSYQAGEELVIRMTVTNETETTLEGVELINPLEENSDQVVTYYEQLAPGQTEVYDFVYIVTEDDVSAGSVESVTAAYGRDENGVEYAAITESITVPTGAGGGEDEGVPSEGLEIIKTETSVPANDSYYVEGETITYTIEAGNTGKVNIVVASLREPDVTGTVELDYIENMAPGEWRTYPYSHTVTADDVEKGVYINYAYADFVSEGAEPYRIYSNSVVSPVGKQSPPKKSLYVPVTSPEDDAAEPADFCRHIVTAHSGGMTEYALEYCGAHAQTATAVQALLAEADTDEALLAAWRQARTLWQQEVGAEYDAMMAEAVDIAKPIILNERVLYTNWLAAYQARLTALFPDDPVLVEKKLAEQLEEKCASLCGETQVPTEAPANGAAAPAQTGEEAGAAVESCVRTAVYAGNTVYCVERVCDRHLAAETLTDALLSAAESPEDLVRAWKDAGALWRAEMNAEQNRGAQRTDGAVRAAIAAEQQAYESWLRANADFLSLMYPGQPELAQEEQTQTLRRRVMDLCGEAEQR